MTVKKIGRARQGQSTDFFDKPNIAAILCELRLNMLRNMYRLKNIAISYSYRAPVVQRPDNFILWISHYPTVSIYANISVFPLVQANMHTPTTVKFGSVPNLGQRFT